MAKMKGLKIHVSSRDEEELLSDPRLDAMMIAVCEELEAKAISIFLAMEVKGPHRLSNTSPPFYIESFEPRRFGNKWRLYNTDPNGFWVEFGAHSGEHHTTPILKYRPLGRALWSMQVV